MTITDCIDEDAMLTRPLRSISNDQGGEGNTTSFIRNVFKSLHIIYRAYKICYSMAFIA